MFTYTYGRPHHVMTAAEGVLPDCVWHQFVQEVCDELWFVLLQQVVTTQHLLQRKVLYHPPNNTIYCIGENLWISISQSMLYGIFLYLQSWQVHLHSLLRLSTHRLYTKTPQYFLCNFILPCQNFGEVVKVCHNISKFLCSYRTKYCCIWLVWEA